MKIVEHVSGLLRGRLQIVGTNARTGESCVLVDSRNLIVDGMYSVLALLASGSVGVGNAISQIALGTNSTAAAVADTAATMTIVKTISYVSVTNPTAYSVRVTGIWASGEELASNVVEAGLLTDNNALLARVVFLPMQKGTDWTWTIQWDLSYEV